MQANRQKEWAGNTYGSVSVICGRFAGSTVEQKDDICKKAEKQLLSSFHDL
jgi:hypothetical protein